jgi:hypothetical protein
MPVDYKWSDLVVRLYAIRSQRCAGSFTVLDRGLIAEHVVTVTGKAFYDITHEQQIIQTDDIHRKITLYGKFIW